MTRSQTLLLIEDFAPDRELYRRSLLSDSGRAYLRRFTALLVLMTIAYSIASVQGKRIRKKQVQGYVSHVKEQKRTRHHHSYFWIGLCGRLWINSLNL